MSSVKIGSQRGKIGLMTEGALPAASKKVSFLFAIRVVGVIIRPQKRYSRDREPFTEDIVPAISLCSLVGVPSPKCVLHATKSKGFSSR